MNSLNNRVFLNSVDIQMVHIRLRLPCFQFFCKFCKLILKITVALDNNSATFVFLVGFWWIYPKVRQSLLSLHMTKSYVRTATRSTLKVEANLTQILNFKANFHTEFEPFFKKKIYANNGGHFKIVSIKIKN